MKTDHTKGNSPIRLLICMGVALFFVILILCAEHVGSFGSGRDPSLFPLTILLNSDDGEIPFSSRITPVLIDDVWTVFLPGAAAEAQLEAEWNGRYRLCSENGEDFHEKGTRFPLPWSAGETYTVHTDDPDRTEYRLQILRGGSIPSVFLRLDQPQIGSLRLTDESGKPLTEIVDWLNDSKENETSAQISVLGSDGRFTWVGSVEKIRARGNSSFREIENGRKSYSLNLDLPVGLIDPERACKRWALIADREQTGLSEYYALALFGQLSGGKDADGWTQGEYVDLYIDGSYRGMYLLTQRPAQSGAVSLPEWHYTSRSEEIRKHASSDAPLPAYTYHADTRLTDASTQFTEGGYLLEFMMGIPEDTDCWFKTENGLQYLIRYPTYCTEEQVLFIGSYVQDFENAVLSPTGFNDKGAYYADYTDLDNLADFILTYAYFSNQELFRTSSFIRMDVNGDNAGRLLFGPVWDFETVPEYFCTDLFDEECFYSDFEQYLLPEALWTKSDFMQTILRRAKKVTEVMDEWLYNEGSNNYIVRKCDTIYPSLLMDLTRYAGRDAAYQEFQSGSARELLDAYSSLLFKRQERWRELWDENVYNFGDRDGLQDVTGRNNAYSQAAGGDVFSKDSITVYAMPRPDGD